MFILTTCQWFYITRNWYISRKIHFVYAKYALKNLLNKKNSKHFLKNLFIFPFLLCYVWMTFTLVISYFENLLLFILIYLCFLVMHLITNHCWQLNIYFFTLPNENGHSWIKWLIYLAKHDIFHIFYFWKMIYTLNINNGYTKVFSLSTAKMNCKYEIIGTNILFTIHYFFFSYFYKNFTNILTYNSICLSKKMVKYFCACFCFTTAI